MSFQIVILFLIFGFLLGSAVTYLFIRLFWAMIDRNVIKSLPKYSWERKLDIIDLEKRYDIYIHGPENKNIIYKNIKLKGSRGLIDDSAIHGNEYLLLEQDDGSEILISNYSISLMCLSGTEPRFEIR